MESHGGRIWAERDGEGLGSRFTFTLPTMAETGAASPVSARLSLRETAESGGLILVVDDDPNDLRYVRGTLADAGCQPIVTEDPEGRSA